MHINKNNYTQVIAIYCNTADTQQLAYKNNKSRRCIDNVG